MLSRCRRVAVGRWDTRPPQPPGRPAWPPTPSAPGPTARAEPPPLSPAPAGSSKAIASIMVIAMVSSGEHPAGPALVKASSRDQNLDCCSRRRLGVRILKARLSVAYDAYDACSLIGRLTRARARIRTRTLYKRGRVICVMDQEICHFIGRHNRFPDGAVASHSGPGRDRDSRASP